MSGEKTHNRMEGMTQTRQCEKRATLVAEMMEVYQRIQIPTKKTNNQSEPRQDNEFSDKHAIPELVFDLIENLDRVSKIFNFGKAREVVLLFLTFPSHDRLFKVLHVKLETRFSLQI